MAGFTIVAADPKAWRRSVRRGLWLSSVSVVWTVTTGGAEVVLGTMHHVLALIAFGAAGALDAAGSVLLVMQFDHARRNDVLREHHERRAALVIGVGLVGLGGLTTAESVRRLAGGHHDHGTDTGALVAAASVVVLAALGFAKQGTGRRLASRALVADGWLSVCGAALAAVAVVAATLGGEAGLWWLDPLSALVVAVVASAYGSAVILGRPAGMRSGLGVQRRGVRDADDQPLR